MLKQLTVSVAVFGAVVLWHCLRDNVSGWVPSSPVALTFDPLQVQ